MIIYKIVCKITGKIYIGQTLDYKQRCSYHKTYLKRNSHPNLYLQRSWNKYGQINFKFEIIEKCTSLLELNEREIYWINYLNSADSKYGFNIQLGGHSDRPSERGLEKLREKAKRLNKSVRQYDLKGNLLNEFISLKEAAKEVKCKSSQIHACCTRNIIQTTGFQFRYANENFDKIEDVSNFKEINSKRWADYNVKNKSKAVIQKTITGDFIAKFNSIREAVRLNGFKNSSQITNCLTKRKYCYSAYGFKWEYEKILD